MGAKDGFLPGMEPKKDRQIHRLAIAYDEAKHATTQAKALENEARDKLEQAMEKKGITVYSFDGVVVELVEATRVKVKVTGEGDGEDAED